MKKLIILATLLAVTASQGAYVRWAGDAGGGSLDYTDGASWTLDGATAHGSMPVTGDEMGLIIDAYSSAMPTLSTAVDGNVPDLLVMGWGTDGGHLTIANGGVLYGLQVIVADQGTGSLLIEDGGVLYAQSYLVLGNNGGVGTVDMTGGLLYSANFVPRSGTLNMTGGALFVHAGDTTGNAWENSDILASGAGESISAVYDVDNARTVYTVIPEPATFGLVAAFGGALLFVRKKIMI